MKYSGRINYIKAIEWKLTPAQCILFDWMYDVPSWASHVMIKNEIYYFASRNKAIKDLVILTDKEDTMYRYFKQLEKKGLIKILKIENRDYIQLTEKAKGWDFINSEKNPTLGKKSGHSEMNPNELGNKSESNSEINPTNYSISNYYNIKNNSHTSDSKFQRESVVKSKEINFNEMINFFNQNRGVMSEVKFLTKARENIIQSIINQYSIENFRTVITKAKNSNFLQGQGPNNWIASFDWIMGPANFINILEGNYDNKTENETIKKRD